MDHTQITTYFKLNKKERRKTGRPADPMPKKNLSAATIAALAAAPMLAVTVFLLRNCDLAVIYGSGTAVICMTLAISILIGLIAFLISRKIAGSIYVLNTIILFLAALVVWASVWSVDIQIMGVKVRVTMLAVSVLTALTVGIASARITAVAHRENALKKGASIAVAASYFVALVLMFLYFVLVVHWHYFACEGRVYTIAEKFGIALVPVTICVLVTGVLTLVLVRKFPKLTAAFETAFFLLLIALIVLGFDWYAKIRIFPYTVEGAYACMRTMQVIGGIEGAILCGIFLSKILPASERTRV